MISSASDADRDLFSGPVISATAMHGQQLTTRTPECQRHKLGVRLAMAAVSPAIAPYAIFCRISANLYADASGKVKGVTAARQATAKMVPAFQRATLVTLTPLQ